MTTFALSASARTYPVLPYERIKNDILGSRYNLSLCFAGAKRAQQLNQNYRQKTYVPNVLAFPLTATTGEIIITPTVARREAKHFDMSVSGYIGFLFIHGCLHLKGHDHGATMEKAERRYCTKYHLS